MRSELEPLNAVWTTHTPNNPTQAHTHGRYTAHKCIFYAFYDLLAFHIISSVSIHKHLNTLMWRCAPAPNCLFFTDVVAITRGTIASPVFDYLLTSNEIKWNAKRQTISRNVYFASNTRSNLSTKRTNIKTSFHVCLSCVLSRCSFLSFF